MVLCNHSNEGGNKQMARMTFNRNKVALGNSIEQPSDELVRNTLSLRQASLKDALAYGGDLTKAAIGAMNLRGDRKYIVVDTKVHYLMPSWCPAIPGWHTDGVPRGEEKNPAGKGLPNIFAQEDKTINPPRYHLLVTGSGCLTEFLNEKDVQLSVPSEPNRELYKWMTQQVNNKVENGELTTWQIPSCTVAEWDWWEIHQGIWATKAEWRYLIRVTETDHIPPRTDLRDMIRTQNLAYVESSAYGW